MTIRDYLCREAERITAGALAGITSANAWRDAEPLRRQQYKEMIGLDAFPPPGARPEVPVTVTGVVERPTYRIEKLYYESLPGLYVTANLYVPNGLTEPAPAVLYVCGHADNQKVHYQAHPRRFAELGFICLIAETVQLGEVKGYHHGCYREGWFHWYSRGYTPGGIEALNGSRALDMLSQRPDVDGTRFGMTGISGGGSSSWWTAAYDERIGVAAPVCGTSTLESHVVDRMLDDHCDCMWWNNTYLWDMADVAALIAPRPLMIASSNRDSLNTIAAIRKVHAQVEPLYEMLGVAENLKLVATPGPHAYHEQSRTAIFSFFIKHLMGRDVPLDAVGDIDDSPAKQESLETLRVYTNGFPSGNRTPMIQDDLFKPPVLPEITSVENLEQVRHGVAQALRERTFRAFPLVPPPLDVRVEYEFLYKTGRQGCRFRYTSEEGLHLYGRFLGPHGDAIGKAAASVIVALRTPGETLFGAEDFAGRFSKGEAVAAVEMRGAGETSWGPELQWHIRRAAAWTGRTIASMQVWDALCALKVVRQLPQVQAGASIMLAAQGEMAAVALYVALLDGDIAGLFLDSPPATQNAPSSPDGRGAAIEMLNCLHITDLPQVASLLFPAKFVISGAFPDSYTQAKDLYARFGKPEAFQRIGDIVSEEQTGRRTV